AKTDEPVPPVAGDRPDRGGVVERGAESLGGGAGAGGADRIQAAADRDLGEAPAEPAAEGVPGVALPIGGPHVLGEGLGEAARSLARRTERVVHPDGGALVDAGEAGLLRAGRGAAIAVGGVAVVALLAQGGLHHPVAAVGRLHLADKPGD